MVRSLNEVDGLKAPRPSSCESGAPACAVPDVPFFVVSGVGASRVGISKEGRLIH